MPLLIVGRRRLLQSRLAAALRRRETLTTALTVGIVLHLVTAAVGVAAGVPGLWQVGFWWSDQWWWSLAPESAQPWLFAATRGAVYGIVAAIFWEFRDGAVRRSRDLRRPAGNRRRWRLVSTFPPALWTALTALAVSCADTGLGTQYSLLAALLGAAVGRSVTLLMTGRGGSAPPDHHGP